MQLVVDYLVIHEGWERVRASVEDEVRQERLNSAIQELRNEQSARRARLAYCTINLPSHPCFFFNCQHISHACGNIVKQTRLKGNGGLMESVENLKLLKVQKDEKSKKEQKSKFEEDKDSSPEQPSSPREQQISDEQQIPVSERLYAVYTAAKEWLVPKVQKCCMFIVAKIVKIMEYLAEKHLENGNLISPLTQYNYIQSNNTCFAL